MRTIDRNKNVVRRFFDQFGNEGNLDIADELFSDDFFDHAAPPGTRLGPEGAKQFLKKVRTSFPDLHITLEDLIAEKDKVVVRITVRGTHEGDLMGVSPTHRQATWKGIDIFRMIEGKIVERWVSRDTLGMMQQLGILPPVGK
jgi:steroid delta-isomerase-like uncharacterized protein